MSEEALARVVQAASRLLAPSAPQVLSLLGRSTPDLRAVEKAIALDAVLSVRVISHANHSFYARRVPVTSVNRALARLGWDASTQLLTRLVMESSFSGAGGNTAEILWHRAASIAVLCRVLAQCGRGVDPGLAFTAGLTHNLGQLGLLAVHRGEYAKMVQGSRSGPHLAHSERQTWGYDHAQVGQGVLSQLNVPAELPMAVAMQYRARLHDKDWTPGDGQAVAALIQLCHMALYKQEALLRDPEQLMKHPLAWPLHLDATKVENAYDRFDKELCEILGIDQETVVDDEEDEDAGRKSA